jgi:hypothetical protein
MNSRTVFGFFFVMVFGCTNSAFGQGLVRNANNITAVMKALIYGVDPGNPYEEHPKANVFAGPLLQGSGYTIQLWGVGGTTLHPNALLPAINGISVFRTGGAAGIWTETAASIQNVPGGPGSHATAQVRVWDNRGGTVLTWSDARADRSIPSGASFLFGIDDLGDGVATAPGILINLQSFQLSIPEPSTLALGIAGGLALLCMGRSKK